MQISEYINDSVEGLVVGVLAAITIIYAFNTQVPYPEPLLQALHHPWVILILFAIAVMLFHWSRTASVLMILMLLAFCMDVYVFATKPIQKESPVEQLSRQSTANAVPYDEPVIKRIPGVGVTSTNAGVTLSSVSLPTPRYPMFNLVDSDTYATF